MNLVTRFRALLYRFLLLTSICLLSVFGLRLLGLRLGLDSILLIRVLAIGLAVVLLLELKHFIKRVRQGYKVDKHILVFLAIFTLFSAVVLARFFFSSGAGLLTLTQTQKYPETFVSLQQGTTYQSTFQPTFNFFGGVELIFKPVAHLPLENTQKTSLVFKLIDEQTDQVVYENDYDILFDDQRTFSFPFGFPIINESKQARYRVEIELQDQSAQNLLVAVTSPNDQLVVQNIFSLSRKVAGNHLQDAMDIMTARLWNAVWNTFFLFFVAYVVLMLTILISWKLSRSVPVMITSLLLVSLGLLSTEMLMYFQFIPYPVIFEVTSALRYLSLVSALAGVGLFAMNLVSKTQSPVMNFTVSPSLRQKLPTWLLSGTFQSILKAAPLIFVLSIFTLVKAPYLDLNFTGSNTMKYNSYVEPALHMRDQQNIFFNEVRYRANPVSNPTGQLAFFERLPILEWSLFGLFSLFPHASIELLTRSLMHFQGIVCLIFFYLVLKNWWNTRYALLATTLLAMNPIFSFASFVTVYDMLVFVCMFISLYLYQRFNKSQNYTTLYWSGLVFGLGTVSKYSLFLWFFPIMVALLFFNRQSLKEWIYKTAAYFLLGVLPTLATRTSIYFLPSNQNLGLGLLSIWLLVFGLLFVVFKHVPTLAKSKIVSFLSQTWVSLGILATVMSVATLAVYKSSLFRLAANFLTDTDLLFNFQLYAFMVKNQFSPYIGSELAPLAGISLLLLPVFLYLKKYRPLGLIITSFVFGSLCFWVVTSKAIFFHNYYNLIFIITAYLLISLVWYVTSRRLPTVFFVVFWLFVAAYYFPNLYRSNVNRLAEQKEGLEAAAQYLEQNTTDGDLYIDDSDLLTLTIMTDRARVEYFLQPEIRQLVREVGLASAMDHYRIKYLVSSQYPPNYASFVPLFTDEANPTPLTRSELILNRIEGRPSHSTDYQALIEKYQLPEKLVLESAYGKFYFYSFRN